MSANLGARPSPSARASLNTARRSDRTTSTAVDDPMMQYTLQLMAQRISAGLPAIPNKQEHEMVRQRGTSRHSCTPGSAGPPVINKGFSAVLEDGDSQKAPTEGGDLNKEIEGLEGLSIRVSDPNLIFSMERTLFYGHSLAIALSVSGVHMMTIGSDNPGGSTSFGAFINSAGLAYMAISYFMHCWRLWRLERGMGLASYDTQVWVGLGGTFLFVCLFFEIYYGFKYPFNDRSKDVTIDLTGGE